MGEGVWMCSFLGIFGCERGGGGANIQGKILPFELRIPTSALLRSKDSKEQE